ncbi:hypothetical protein D9M71_692490 [compost metagenome]
MAVAFHQRRQQELAGAVDVGGSNGLIAGGAAFGDTAVGQVQVFGRAAKGTDIAQPVVVGHGDLKNDVVNVGRVKPAIAHPWRVAPALRGSAFQTVGWVERSDTHAVPAMMGIASSTHPTH